jgi:hypothetical protein
MLKDEFIRELRAELRMVPVEARRQWTNADLFDWWLRVSSENPNLRWGGPLDWQQVHRLCIDMIGEQAEG